MAKKPLILMILDGWGLAPAGPGNAVTLAKTPYLDKCFAHCPHTELAASGEDVGLPAGQIGNSEVGHLNIGAAGSFTRNCRALPGLLKTAAF